MEMIKMSLLSDTIEEFIKQMLKEEEQGYAELKRNELAEYFRCAPSQINYVLRTRFTTDRGYCIESRRGGGGYVRVIRLQPAAEVQLTKLMLDSLPEYISERQALQMVERLYEHADVNLAQARLMAAALSNEALALPPEVRDLTRARIMRSMLIALVRDGAKEEE